MLMKQDNELCEDQDIYYVNYDHDVTGWINVGGYRVAIFKNLLIYKDVWSYIT